MKVWVVTKSPVDMPDVFEFVGVFSTQIFADASCYQAGTYKIAEVEMNRRYFPQPLNVYVKHVLTNKQF